MLENPMTLAPTILLAEDQPALCRAIQVTLQGMGFAVRATDDGETACTILEEMKDDSPPDLLITDIDLPGCDGEQLASFARQRCGQIKLIFMSGAMQPGLSQSIATDPDARFLKKPFSPADLGAALHQLGLAASAA